LFAKQFLPNFGGVTLFLNYNYVGLQRKKIDFTKKKSIYIFRKFQAQFSSNFAHWRHFDEGTSTLKSWWWRVCKIHRTANIL